jgi:putative endonuclease
MQQNGSRAYHAGRAAEEIAERAYEAQGGRVLARRWRCGEGEIDLVVALGSVIAFVEVKFCRRQTPDSPIRPRQWQRVANAAARWLAERPDPPAACRFDAALVGSAGGLTLIENAHIPGLA